MKQLRQTYRCQICLSGLPTAPTKVKSKRQDYLQENTAVAMNFEAEKNVQKSQLLIQMKARDVMKTLALECICKFGGVFLC